MDTLALGSFGLHAPGPGLLHPVPATLARDLAPAAYLVYEWAEYWVEAPGADHLLVGGARLPAIAGHLFRLRFENRLGLATIRPYAGSTPLAPPLHVEVISPKFPTPERHVDFFRTLLHDLFARAARLPFALPAADPATARGVVPSPQPPTPLFAYHFLCQQAPVLRAALATITATPHRRLHDRPAEVPLAAASEVDADVLLAILRAPHEVDGIETLVFQRDALYLVVDLDAMPSSEQAAFPHISTGQVSGRRYPGVPTACGLRIPTSELSQRLPAAREPHIRLVKRGATFVKTKGHRHGTHSPGVVSYLGQQLRRESPNPSYCESNVFPSLEQPTPKRTDAASTEPTRVLATAFASASLSYTSWQIATFYSAVQTKGFVILSGISGTGKSKLATQFARLFPLSKNIQAGDDENEVITITVQSSTLKDGTMIIPRRVASLIDTPAPGEMWQILVTFESTSQSCRLTHWAYPNKQYLGIFLRDDIRRAIADVVGAGDVLSLKREIDPNGKLVGIRFNRPALTEDSPPELRQEGSNALFLSARPDWRDSKCLLGYHNPLTGSYQWTPFLRFLLRATASYEAKDGLAWFLILDEMNLAQVEYYFADLLSVLESGRDADGWTREPLRLALPDDGAGLDPTADPDLPPRELRLPPNLYLVGTVNVDETTHAFSPKVIDRAFTLDLTEVDFSNYPLAPTTDSPTSGGRCSRSSRAAGILLGSTRGRSPPTSRRTPRSQGGCRR